MKKKSSFLFLTLLLLIVLLITVYRIMNKIKEGFTLDIVLVISRYNENLEWLKNEPFSKYPVIIYNKGNNDDFYRPDKLIDIIKIDNVGRESHTYLYHIINNYNKLNQINVFLPGSTDLPAKLEKATDLLNKIEENQCAVFQGIFMENVYKELYDFQLDIWKSSHESNAKVVKKNDLEPSMIRPYGKWFEERFGEIKIQYITYYGIFSVDKYDILQHPKSYYENLITELEVGSNPEVGHYYERSWAVVFYPLTYTKIV